MPDIDATTFQFVAMVIVGIVGAIALGAVLALATLDHEAHMKARRARARFDRREAR